MANHLQSETSPYLLQHAENPVEWYPWNEQALRLARETGKPILLSIGYSACHWCHVMAHESFEDDETAKLMNELYVNIKVDREERPDIDKIYQLAHQLITGRPGGWPLTVFLSPRSHVPVFAGTYFPNAPRYGMPSFSDVLRRVADYYREHAEEVETNGRALTKTLESIESPGESDPEITIGRAPLSAARDALGQSFDAEHGGFGTAPKFPHASNLDFLLAWWRSTAQSSQPDLDALGMVALTLTRMAQGGLYDQLGGGFFRYSVDRYWRIPHFEKMLYDNAALLALYADAYAATGEALFGRVANETADWVLRDMRHPSGGFFSTLDADSEGEEGKFYIWTPEQVEAVLDEDERRIASEHFGLKRAPNFEGKHWHLEISTTLKAIAEQEGSLPRVEQALESARRKLLAARAQRPPPGRDEKILTSWNALMIKAMAIAARHLRRDDLAVAATRAVDFIRGELWDGQRLLAVYKDGRARFPAYLDDYAFLAEALVELLQCRWRTEDLEFARALLGVLLAQFEDERGGFYFTAHEHEKLMHRTKTFADESTPAGNAVAAMVLTKLGHLLGEGEWLAAAERSLHAAWPMLERYPQAHTTLLRALMVYLEPPDMLVLRGTDERLEEWARVLDSGYHPHRLAFYIPVETTDLPGLLGQLHPHGDVVAYVCRGSRCEAPVETLESLLETLRAGAAPGA